MNFPTVQSRQPRRRIKLFSSDISISETAYCQISQDSSEKSDVLPDLRFFPQINAPLGLCSRPKHVVKLRDVEEDNIYVDCQTHCATLVFQS